MRIALITGEYPGCGPSHGVGTYTQVLARALEASGSEVGVFVVNAEGAFAGPPDAVVLQVRHSTGSLLRPLLLGPWLRRALADFGPQVVEVPNWGGLGVMLPEGAHVVRLSTPVSTIVPRGLLARLARPIHHRRECLTVSRAQVVIANSRVMADLARQVYGREAEVVIPHAISCPANPPAPRVASTEVLYVGRMEHRKGVDVLLAAWQVLAVRVPEARLHLVGAGGEGYREVWSHQPTIHHHGPLQGELLEDLRSRCSIQVIPSRFESFGMVALEAWRDGLAVVAADAGGLGEVVGGVGLLVPPGDAPALAEGLAGLLKDPSRIAVLAARGAERLRERHGPAGLAAATLSAYSLLVHPGSLDA